MIPCTEIFKGRDSIHTGRKTGPLFVWNITDVCNLRCKHCYRDSSALNAESGLSDDRCIKLVDEIKELSPPIVLLTGGEPLLRNNVFDIIARCKESGLRVGLSTNGTVIDEGAAYKIKESGVDYVGISIDGGESLHDEFRGVKGAFRQSWNAIERLNKIGVKTGVRFTLTDENKADLFYVMDKAQESGTKRFCLYHLVYSGRARDLIDIEPQAKRRIMDMFFNKVQELSLIDRDFDVLTTDNHADGVYLSERLTNHKAALSCIKSHGGCSAGDRVLYLDSTGDVCPCQFLRDESIGNVKEKPLSEIWRDTDNPLLNMFRNKKDFLSGKCGTCMHKEICGGCRARAKASSGSLWGEDPGCYLDLKEKEIALKT